MFWQVFQSMKKYADCSFFVLDIVLRIIFRKYRRSKIIVFNRNDINWHDVGVQACQIQLFGSLHVYSVEHNFFAVIADRLAITKDHRIEVLVQFGVQDCKGVAQLNVLGEQPSTTHLHRHLPHSVVVIILLLPVNVIDVREGVIYFI